MKKGKQDFKTLTKVEANKVKGGGFLSSLFGRKSNRSAASCCPPPEPSDNL